jgi:hypothetical protein
MLAYLAMMQLNMDGLKIMITKKNEKHFSDWIEIESAKIKIESLSNEKKIELADFVKYEYAGNSPINTVKLARMILKYYVKDWQNFMFDEEGKEIICKVEKGLLAEDLFNELCLHDEIVFKVAEHILSKVNDLDFIKKK